MPPLTPEMIEAGLKFLIGLVGEYQAARAVAAARLYWREKAEPAFKIKCDVAYDTLATDWALLGAERGPLPHE